MYCIFCGKELPEDAVVCPNCNQPVEFGTVNVPEQTEVENESDTNNYQNNENEPDTNNYQNDENEPDTNNYQNNENEPDTNNYQNNKNKLDTNNSQNNDENKQKSSGVKIAAIIVILAILGGIGFGGYCLVNWFLNQRMISEIQQAKYTDGALYKIGEGFDWYLDDEKWTVVKDGDIKKVQVTGIRKEDGKEHNIKVLLWEDEEKKSDEETEIWSEYYVDSHFLKADEADDLHSVIFLHRTTTFDDMGISVDKLVKDSKELQFYHTNLNDFKPGDFVWFNMDVTANDSSQAFYLKDAFYGHIVKNSNGWREDSSDIYIYDYLSPQQPYPAIGDIIKVYGKFIMEREDGSIVVDAYHYEVEESAADSENEEEFDTSRLDEDLLYYSEDYVYAAGFQIKSKKAQLYIARFDEEGEVQDEIQINGFLQETGDILVTSEYGADIFATFSDKSFYLSKDKDGTITDDAINEWISELEYTEFTQE